MSDIDREEIKCLVRVLEKVEAPNPSIVLRSWFNPVLWVVCVFVMFLIFQLHEKLNNPYILPLVSGAVSSIVTSLFIMQSAEKNWPYIKKHLNVESIKEAVNREGT